MRSLIGFALLVASPLVAQTNAERMLNDRYSRSHDYDLVHQRIEVGGQVTDLRDSDATTPLLRTSGRAVTAAGLAGAPGDGAEAEGIVGFALATTCS